MGARVEQLQIDFDPEATAAEEQAAAARDAAFADLVAIRAVTVAQARERGLYDNELGDDDTVTVWICPACEAWEPNEMLLSNGHGIRREYLIQWPNGEWANDGAYYGRRWCQSLDLTASHATYDTGYLHPRQLAMLARLRPEVRSLYDREVATSPRRYPPQHDSRR
ncbi:Uncharacterised protein [Mycobacteroides abscessus subsp. abscessus]|uniref:hypothetical protein n=1 Tax=Mycobacteroides abscessus TaxID=36809 RepID=UPI000926D67F|nr:hypothetical protein [Mycobacteroides abscessus]SHU69325.1 Uncharacterised protein [Mycobacteroides abscessus subsp. abscessus]